MPVITQALCFLFFSVLVTPSFACSVQADKTHHIDIYGHRGLRALAPENTLPSYSAALKIGVDVIDIDVNMTSDGVLVVTHDFTLNPDITQNADGSWISKSIPINQLTLKELQQYRVGNVKPDSGYQAIYPNRILIEDVQIPTLEQVIHFVKDHENHPVRFQIEMKTDPTQPKVSGSPYIMARELAMFILQNHIQNRVEVQSFQWQALVNIKKLIPGIKTGFLTAPTYEPANKHDEKRVGTGRIWTAPLSAKDFNYDYPKMISKLGGTLWEPYEMNVTKQQIEHAHQLGVKVVPWGWAEQEGTDFNYQKINQLIDWGVDGIITDRADILRGLLAVKPKKLS